MTKLSPEFQLLCACCRRPHDAATAEQVRARAAEVDWNVVLKLSRRHRVAGLLQSGLAAAQIEVPAPFDLRLRTAAAQAARKNLRFAAEALQLQKAFDAAGLKALFIKGATLEKLAYGAIGIKEAWDIDLLVDPADVPAASRLLSQCGYKRLWPGEDVSPGWLAQWIARVKEATFEQRKVFVELHWRLTDNPLSIPDMNVHSEAQQVEISPGAALRTLADGPLFSYCCEHGARHGWARLKWLADVAAFLSAKSPDQIASLYAYSQKDGIHRAPGQALLLCARLFGLPLPNGLHDAIAGDRRTRWLEAVALRMLTDGDREPDDQLSNIALMQASHFLLKDGARFRWTELTSRSLNGKHMMALALPERLSFLYPVVRVTSFLRAALRRGPSRAPLRR